MYVQLMRGPDFTGDTYGSLIDRFQTLAPREGTPGWACIPVPAKWTPG